MELIPANRNAQGLSKSKRRKLRLLARGAQTTALVPVSNKVIPATSGRATRRRRSRNRRRSGRAAPGTGNSGNTEYLNALMFPESASGCKVLDMISYPTSTFTINQEVWLATGANAAADSCAIQIRPIIGEAANAIYPMYVVYGLGAGTLEGSTPTSWSDEGTVQTMFEMVRVVSMSASAYFIGNTSEDKGVICGTCVTNYDDALPTTYNGWVNMPGMEEYAARQGIRVVWKPLDNASLEFLPAVMTSAWQPDYNKLPNIFIAASGLTPNAAGANKIRVRIAVNFEAIPNLSSADYVGAEPSPYYPDALRRAFTWAQQVGNNINAIVSNAGPYLNLAETALGALGEWSQSRNYIGDNTIGFPRATRNVKKSNVPAIRSALAAIGIGKKSSKEELEDLESKKEIELSNLKSDFKILDQNCSKAVVNLESEIKTLKATIDDLLQALSIKSASSSPQIQKFRLYKE